LPVPCVIESPKATTTRGVACTATSSPVTMWAIGEGVAPRQFARMTAAPGVITIAPSGCTVPKGVPASTW
jgi:hypothetical protein